MNHPHESIETLIRKGTSLTLKIGMITRDLEYKANDHHENRVLAADGKGDLTRHLANHINFLTVLPDGLEKSILDIFSLVCSFHHVEYGGIYIFNRQQRRLDLVCHYNLPDESLAKMITFRRNSWQVKALFDGKTDFNCLEKIPLHDKIAYEIHDIQSVAIIPLIYQGQVVGCMKLSSQKKEIANAFEQVLIEALAVRISRTVALQLAQVRLNSAMEELCRISLHLESKFQILSRQTVNGPLAGFFFGMKEEIEGLSRAIFLVTEKIMQKLTDGQRSGKFPFIQKKVDTMLGDIDFIIGIISRLRVFFISHSATIEQGIQPNAEVRDGSFLDFMVELNHALEVLVMEEKKQKHAVTAFIAGQYKPLQRPVKLADLNFRIDRLNQN